MEEKNGDRSNDARSLLAQADLQFVGLLVTMTSLLGEAKTHSDCLQSPNLDLSLAVDLFEILVQILKKCSAETQFEELWGGSYPNS